MRAVAEAHSRELAKTELGSPVPASSASSGTLPFLLAAFAVGLAMLGLALTPTEAVPWRRGSRILKQRRDEIAVLGAMSLVVTILLFLFVQASR